LSPLSSLEPFAERIRSHGLDQWCIGYRLQDGEVVSSIVVSASLLGECFFSSSSINLRLSIDGLVSANMSELTDSVGAPRSEVAIDELLRETLMAENLRLEEASAKQLSVLEGRLKACVNLVRHLINQMED
jgi:hypothetical protein